LEQLLTVTEVERDQNHQPLHDSRGLVIHKKTSGWRRQDAGESQYRWVHDGLQRYFQTAPANRPSLHLALESSDPAIVATAVIGLARTEGARHRPALLRLIHPRRIETDRGVELRTYDMPVRRAAIETLAAMQDPQVDQTIEELLEIYSPGTDGAGSDGLRAQLHAELLDALARRRPAGSDPRFLAAFESPFEEVQATAVRCLVADRGSPLPREVTILIAGGRSRLRIMAIEACGLRGDPATVPPLRAAAYDPDLSIRLAAIDALGKVGGEQAIDALRRILRESKTRLREAAVLALAEAGDFASVFNAARYEDARVRRAAAEGLATVSDRRAAQVAGGLLDDASADVQSRVVSSLDQWPLERAGPLLLRACGSVLPTTRRAAFASLARRWPPAAHKQDEFEFAATEARGEVQSIEARKVEQQRRRELLAGLEQQWREQFGDPVAMHMVGDQAPPPIEQAGELAGLQRATAALASPYGAERRAALVHLAERSRQSPPNKEVLRAVALASSREDEAANWLLLLEIGANSDSDVAPEIAYAALRQPVAEVKIAACRLLADRPSPAHVPHLLRQLDAHTPHVTSAALKALGGCGPVEDTIPMELLLACSSPELRVDAAAALARLGVRSGTDALERLLIHRDPKVKVRAVHAIADLQDPLFLAALMDLLDRKIDFSVRRAVVAALPVITAHDITEGRDREQAAVENFAAGSVQWQEQRWRDWYYSGGRSS
jgi:HEAT repeat protein